MSYSATLFSGRNHSTANEMTGKKVPSANHPQKLRPVLRAKKAVDPGMNRKIGARKASSGIDQRVKQAALSESNAAVICESRAKDPVSVGFRSVSVKSLPVRRINYADREKFMKFFQEFPRNQMHLK